MKLLPVYFIDVGSNRTEKYIFSIVIQLAGVEGLKRQPGVISTVWNISIMMTHKIMSIIRKTNPWLSLYKTVRVADTRKPVVLQTLTNLNSFLWRPRQHSRNEGFSLRTVFLKLLFRKSQRSRPNILNSLTVIFRLERCRPTNEFVEKNACRPNVYSLPVPSRKHLRSPIIQSTCYCPHLEPNSFSYEPPRYSKINHFYFMSSWVDKDIFRFDIPMNDIVSVQVTNSIYELPHDVFYVLFSLQIDRRQRGKTNILHRQPSRHLFKVKVQCLILQDIGMPKILHD